jgi:hypothetical protein
MDGMLGSADCNWSVTIDNHGHIMVYPICKSDKSLVFFNKYGMGVFDHWAPQIRWPCVIHDSGPTMFQCC